MTKILRNIIILVVIVVLTFTTHLMKSVALPMSTDCTATCFSWTAWNGTINGAKGTFTTMPGSTSFNTPSGYDQRALAVWGGSNGQDIGSNIHVGIEMDQPLGGGRCANGSTKAEYFMVWATNTSGNPLPTLCNIMASGDQGQLATFQIGPYVSYGGGIQVQYWGNTGSHNYIDYSYASGIAHTFASMGYQEQIEDTVIGYQVAKANYYYSMWRSTSDNLYHYQTRAIDFLYPNNPPQMYWTNPPNQNNNGGIMVSCVRESGSSC